MLAIVEPDEPQLFEKEKFFPQFNRLVGIDWGNHGGFFWNDGDTYHCARMPMDGDEINVQKVFALLVNEIRPTIAYAEKVDPIPNQSAVATGTFQRAIGRIEGLLVAYGCPTTLVRPQEWQKSLTDKTKGDFTVLSKRGKKAGQVVPSTTQWKKYLQDIAQQLHPQKLITLEIADACLIWRFAQERHAIRVRAIKPFTVSR